MGRFNLSEAGIQVTLNHSGKFMEKHWPNYILYIYQLY